MRVKRYSFPQEMHGKAPASLQMYFNAVGAADDKGITVRPIDPVSTTSTLSSTSNVSQAPATTTTVTPVGSGATAPTVGTAPSAPALNQPATTVSTSPSGTIQPINAVPLIQNIIQPVIPGIVGRELSTPVITASGGGGGGGFGMPSEEEKPVAAPVKKKTVFPWLLIAAGIYMIVEKPLK